MRHWCRATAAALPVALALANCGGGEDRVTLSWYTNPDDGGQAEIASRCTEAAGGRYVIETSVLPTDASAQREQLLRRLAAEDGSIDIMSLDPVFVAEFAEAGFLAPIPEDAAAGLTEGVFEPAVVGATWKDELVAAPFWANTQLLWFRRSVAEEAGVDPEATDLTWEQIVEAAEQTGTTVGLQGNRYEGYMVLVNSLVESAGGHIVENPGAGADDLETGIDSPAGERAAEVIRMVAGSDAAMPGLSTADEEAARALFQGDRGGFMVNWPYVWRAANAAVEDGALDEAVVADIGWARWPAVEEGQESRPPLGGIDLGIGAWSEHPDLALEAIQCITSVENQAFYFVNDGNPAARPEVFDRQEVVEAFPMAPLIRESLEASAPRPQTEFYGDISSAIQRSFHPPEEVSPDTPRSAASLIEGVLAGDTLL